MNTSFGNITPTEAIALQKELRKQIVLGHLEEKPTYIGGGDISFNKYSKTIYAGIVVLRFPDLIEVCRATVITETHFPYIPGLLSFREVPALLKAWELVEIKPDVMVLDGQGIAHPRRFGVASHFGLLTGVPTIGCAKSLLIGTFTEPGAEAGERSPLFDKAEQIGVVVRTKKHTKPVFVSPGHKTSFENSIDILGQCITSYRIPEPTRRAHLLVNQLRTSHMEGRKEAVQEI